VIDRNSLDSPIFPRTGSQLTFSIEATPPYSLLNGKDYTTISSTEKYRWTEYHKWKFDGSWFVPLTKKTTVFNARFRYGFLGYYSKAFGLSPFERFQYGGDGLANFSFFGLEIIGMRGYEVRDFAANSGYGTIFGKTTLELRQAISLESMATIWVHAFFDAGNVWNRFDSFNPFQVKKSFGLGVRVFMPMFGLLGLDAGIPMDPAYNGQWKPKFTFVLGQQL
jgi:outer membrane protein insertion porin family